MKKIVTHILQLTLTSALTLLTHTAYSQGSGHALSFDGVSNYVSCGDITALDNATSFTISGWFVQDALDQRRNMWVKDVNTNTMVRARTWSDGRLYTYVENNSNSHGSFDYSQYINPGEWFHYCCVYDGSGATNSERLKVYINGQEIPMTYLAGAIPTSTANLSGNPFRIADETYEADATWNGKIDEFRIWSTALTQTEIRENMCQKLTGAEPNLVAYFRMDEGIDNSCSGGEDVCDLTGNGNHGTKF